MNDPKYPEEDYRHLAETMGEEAAAWARLPRAKPAARKL